MKKTIVTFIVVALFSTMILSTYISAAVSSVETSDANHNIKNCNQEDRYYIKQKSKLKSPYSYILDSYTQVTTNVKTKTFDAFVCYSAPTEAVSHAYRIVTMEVNLKDNTKLWINETKYVKEGSTTSISKFPKMPKTLFGKVKELGSVKYSGWCAANPAGTSAAMYRFNQSLSYS